MTISSAIQRGRLAGVLSGVVSAAVVLVASAGAAPSDLDPSFGGSGFVLTPFEAPNVSHPSRSTATALVVLPDGKVVAAGTFSDQFGNNGGIAVARYQSDGTLDSGFGAAGKVVTDYPGFSYVHGNAAVVQSDGKLVVGGSALSYATGEIFALARYDTSGSLDPSFGAAGRVTTSFATYSYGGLRSLALQADGKLVAAGTFAGPSGGNALGVARYNSDGSLDTTFGQAGLALVTGFYSWEAPDVRGVVVQPDGRIVVTSPAAGQFVLVRLNQDGSLDGSFGTNGIARPRYGNPFALALQPDGKIVEVGTSGSGFQLAVTRVNADGSTDTGFGVNGSVDTGFLPSVPYQAALAVRVQANGKIVAAGSGDGDKQYVVLARITPDGALDPGFGDGGRILTAFPGMSGQVASALALQPDGRIVAAGHAIYPDGDYVFAVARYLGDPTVRSVAIDIRPESGLNVIPLSSSGAVPVAILTTDAFDATSVDAATVCFGDVDEPSQRDCTEKHGHGHVVDVNADRRPDLLLHFDIAESGIDPADLSACLTGTTRDGELVEGCDSIRTQ